MSDNTTPDQAAPAISDAEREQAEKDGVKAAVTKSAETNFSTRVPETETNSPGDRWPDRSDIMQFAALLDLSPEDFAKRVAADSDQPIAESKVAGLLGLERNGQNRTPFVKAMCERLGVKSPFEVTHGGPPYTNDVKPLSFF